MTPNELLLLRREANLTQSELGKRIGYSRQAVINWERKNYRISDDAARAITEACTKHMPKPDTTGQREALKVAKAWLDGYRHSRASGLTHRDIISLWIKAGVDVPDLAKEMIREAYPDI